MNNRPLCTRNRDKGDHIIISEVEHSPYTTSPRPEKNGFKVAVPVDQYGKINMQNSHP
jgi:cysteine sulfinate desulfinase/cysteine desulfurase-like protein